MARLLSITLTAITCTLTFAQAEIRVDSLKKGEAEEFTDLCFYTIPPTKGQDSPQALAVDKETGGWLIRVNGKLHRMKIISEKSSLKPKQKAVVGDTFEQVCSDGELSLTLNYRISVIGIESTKYVGEMTVKLGKKSATFKIIGYDGC